MYHRLYPTFVCASSVSQVNNRRFSIILVEGNNYNTQRKCVCLSLFVCLRSRTPVCVGVYQCVSVCVSFE